MLTLGFDVPWPRIMVASCANYDEKSLRANETPQSCGSFFFARKNIFIAHQATRRALIPARRADPTAGKKHQRNNLVDGTTTFRRFFCFSWELYSPWWRQAKLKRNHWAKFSCSKRFSWRQSSERNSELFHSIYSQTGLGLGGLEVETFLLRYSRPGWTAKSAQLNRG